MKSKVLGLVAAAALLTSLGAANASENATAKAKGPVSLTDNQLDTVTAGDAASQTAFLLSVSTTELNNLLAISNFTLGFLNGVPQPLPSVFTP
jgi:hypothetical protein